LFDIEKCYQIDIDSNHNDGASPPTKSWELRTKNWELRTKNWELRTGS